MDNEEDEDNIEDPVAKLIEEWIKDDKGRNILYKIMRRTLSRFKL